VQPCPAAFCTDSLAWLKLAIVARKRLVKSAQNSGKLPRLFTIGLNLYGVSMGNRSSVSLNSLFMIPNANDPASG